MSLQSLPVDLLNKIKDFNRFLEHKKRNKKVLDELHKIRYEIENRDGWRIMGNGKEIQYYAGWNYDTYEVWIHKFVNGEEVSIKQTQLSLGSYEVFDW